jgi:outer membrane protein assembly factor BamB
LIHPSRGNPNKIVTGLDRDACVSKFKLAQLRLNCMSQAAGDWWTFHGDTDRSGFVSNSEINAGNAARLKTLHTLQLGGPILSTPAVVDGCVYVGTANGTRDGQTASPNGGSFHKIDLQQGIITATFSWLTDRSEGDTHGFTGMGCTPAVVDGRVFFSAFNGRLYCLDADTLSPVWVTDLRIADPAKNQPVSNISGNPALPHAEGWCSPLVVNGRVYVGIGEGENPDLYGFVYCLDADSGKVVWIFCTSQFEEGKDNVPNQIPIDAVDTPLPPGFTLYGDPNKLPVPVVARGCVVWSALTYDPTLKRVFCATGNPQPDSPLPAPGYAYSVLALDAGTGTLEGKVQVPVGSSYRVSDVDIDFGTSPTLFTKGGKTLLGIGCKNGAFLVIDAETMEVVRWRQLLPYFNDNTQIPTVDPHGPDTSSNPNPRLSNDQSNSTPAENFHGTYSTAAVHPDMQRLYVGIGGNNYHFVAAGIDYQTTPFLRAMDWDTLDDAWDLDQGNPRKYIKPFPPMYTTPGEGGLSSPAVVNDVVFCATTKVSLYAFDAKDGTPLWHDDLGTQTLGFNGGYGFCLGPAISGNYVVVGALVNGRDGGVLRIYCLDD